MRKLVPTPLQKAIQSTEESQSRVKMRIKMAMTPAWWDDLGDDELKARLRNRNLPEDEVQKCVRERDRDPNVRMFLSVTLGVE